MADFQGRFAEYNEKGIRVMGASADNLEEAQKMVVRRKLTFPIVFGLDATKFAAMTGAFFDERKKFVHATGFIIRPDGTIDAAVYSTGSIGRLTATAVLMLIDYRLKRSP